MSSNFCSSAAGVAVLGVASATVVVSNGAVGSVSGVDITGSVPADASTTGDAVASFAGAGVGLIGRRSSRKPSERSTAPNSSGEQPSSDIISGVTVKPPSPGMLAPVMRAASSLARKSALPA